MTIPKTIPVITCRQAAEMFRQEALRSPYTNRREVGLARAEMLEAFGDQLVPAALHEQYDFVRGLS